MRKRHGPRPLKGAAGSEAARQFPAGHSGNHIAVCRSAVTIFSATRIPVTMSRRYRWPRRLVCNRLRAPRTSHCTPISDGPRRRVSCTGSVSPAPAGQGRLACRRRQHTGQAAPAAAPSRGRWLAAIASIVPQVAMTAPRRAARYSRPAEQDGGFGGPHLLKGM